MRRSFGQGEDELIVLMIGDEVCASINGSMPRVVSRMPPLGRLTVYTISSYIADEMLTRTLSDIYKEIT